jgi:hypothetical protein
MTRRGLSKYITCERKDQLSYQRAKKLAKRVRRYREEVVEAYRCPYCKRWHIGQPGLQ